MNLSAILFNKKVLLSLGAIAFVAALAAGATYAAWSASDTITGNTIGAATLSITATELGKNNPYALPLPFNISNMLPGDSSSPELRAVISNDSGVPLDLYMYLDGVGGAACEATKLAWQSSNPGNPTLLGYSNVGPIPSNPGLMDDTGEDNNFTFVWNPTHPNLWTIANKVLIADSANFGPGQEIAMRQVVGFANDAPNSLQGTSCQWTLNFVAETI